jgi:hypothetical protein
MDWSDSEQDPVVMWCEYGNTAWNSIKGDLLETYSKRVWFMESGINKN